MIPLLLAMALVLAPALLGGPHALHTGPRDPNIDENLVNGDWFSVAQASNEPKLLGKDSAMMFFVHKIHMTLKTMEFHLYRRIQGMCVPVTMMAKKTKKKFQYTLKYAGRNTIFLEEMDPARFLIFCVHNYRHGKETVVVNLLGRTPTVSWDIMQTFKNYSISHGINPANIINLTRMDRCPRARE